MERSTKYLPAGTYWCKGARRFVTPDEPNYDHDVFDAFTQGPLERGLFGDDERTDQVSLPGTRAA